MVKKRSKYSQGGIWPPEEYIPDSDPVGYNKLTRNPATNKPISYTPFNLEYSSDFYGPDMTDAKMNQSPIAYGKLKSSGSSTKTEDRWKNPFANVKGHDVLQGFLATTDAFVNWQDNQRNVQNYYRTLRNTFTQKPIWDYNNLWGPNSNGGAEYQPLIMAKNGAEIRKSSSPIHGNVEIEGGEFLQLPDLQTEHIQGNSHKTGGVHTNLPSGAKVFSDHLKPKGSKKTYAQLAKKYDTLKYKEVLDNPFAKDPDRRTAEIMFGRNQNILNNLFQDQQFQNGNSDGTKFEDGGTTGGGPIYVTEKNNPRLISYNDSLSLWSRNLNKPSYEPAGPPTYERLSASEREYFSKIPPHIVPHGFLRYESKKKDMVNYMPQFKKPTTEVIYKEPLKKVEIPVPVDNPKTKLGKSAYIKIPTGNGDFEQFHVDYQEDLDRLTKDLGVESQQDMTYTLKSPKLNPYSSPSIKQHIQKNYPDVRFKNGGLYGDDGFLLGNSGKLRKSKTEIGYDPYKSKGEPLDRTRIGKADNSSKLTAEQIDELASLIGYTGPANNLALQQYLLKNNPDIVNQLHTTYGQPNAGRPDDGLWGVRWDAALQAVADKVKSSQPPVANVPAPTLGNTVKNEPTVDTSGRTFDAIAGVTKPYSRIGKFPLYQAAPETLGFLSAISPYSYYTPDFTHNELVPATLNIQPQLNSINSSLQSGIRQNTGNASLMNARNTAMFNQALEAKQQAFANKQNYDAQNRFNADQFNAQARTKENYDDLSAAATVYNEYRAGALDNASTERLNAIASLTNKTAQFYQDEFRKKLFFDTQTPNYYYDGLNIDNPIVYTGEKPTFEAAPKTKASLSKPKKK